MRCLADERARADGGRGRARPLAANAAAHGASRTETRDAAAAPPRPRDFTHTTKHTIYTLANYSQTPQEQLQNTNPSNELHKRQTLITRKMY